MESSDVLPAAEASLAALQRVADARVLVVGDTMLDHYVDGRVERISPEAPVPVVRVEGERRVPGGAANVAAGVTALGAACRLVSLCGDDDAGEALRGLLRDLGVGADGLLTAADRPTTVKSRILARHQQMLRIDRESADPMAEDLVERLLERVGAELGWADVVALVDYDKGVLDRGTGRRIVERASERDVPTVVDPKLRSFRDYPGAFLFKPNGAELAAAFGKERPPLEGDELADVRRRLQCRHLLVTLGEEGMVLSSEGESGAIRIPSEAREVYDVSGAGDTVTATVSAALATGSAVREAASLANYAAGLAVSRLGAMPVGREEIRDALERRAAAGPGGERVESPAGAEDAGAEKPGDAGSIESVGEGRSGGRTG